MCLFTVHRHQPQLLSSKALLTSSSVSSRCMAQLFFLRYLFSFSFFFPLSRIGNAGDSPGALSQTFAWTHTAPPENVQWISGVPCMPKSSYTLLKRPWPEVSESVTEKSASNSCQAVHVHEFGGIALMREPMGGGEMSLFSRYRRILLACPALPTLVLQ